ncbi:MAG: HU family DNA-binding protein [Prevotella sp.]|nr:HU family DNA-binding protein [Candidatus Prevotella equi]
MAVIRDIAKIIAAKHQLKQTDADHFIQMFVEVINEGLVNDRLVKIKGFGTFKLQSMKERTSVNVNTGERVVIGEHDKVTFTPENVMRDIINKPFAHFETVIINNEANLDIIEDEEEYNDTTLPAQEPTTEEPQTVEEPQTIEEPQVVEEPQTAVEEEEEDSPVEVHESTEEQQTVAVSDEANENETETTSDNDTVYEECSEQYPHCRNIFIYYGILINIIVAIVFFALGYFACNQKWFEPKEKTASVVAKPVLKTVKQKKPKEVTPEPKQEIKTKEKEPADNTPKPLTEYDSDVRVRTGAYYIMGTEKEITVQEGQTLSAISKAYLGPDMECYVEAYNKTNTVKAGDKVRIPKLLLKKRYKNSN